MRRRSLKRQKIFIIASSLSLLLFLTIGYAAFQTKITLSAKGNIKEKDGPITIEKLREKVVTEGDGLYSDSTEEGRLVYKGANPNNKITFNNELWRIMSVESDGSLKVIKNESIGNMTFDLASTSQGTRYSSVTTDYCRDKSGCKVWGSKTTTLDSSGNNITEMSRELYGTTYDLPEKEAYLNTYLNNTYYNSLLEKSKELIADHTWNIGLLKSQSGQTLETDLSQESRYKWKGKIALINPTDYVKSNTNTETCGNVYANTSSANNYTTCKETTWLYKSASEWALAPFSISYGGTHWNLYSAGYVQGSLANNSYGVRPVLYLTPNITLSGEGTEDLPYTINEQ